MKYVRPSYIESLPEIWKPYFSEKMFKNTPYPPTEKDANDFLLFNVFKAKEKDSIMMVEVDENGEVNSYPTEFTKENFHEIFNYYNWKKLSHSTKIVALYWYYEEICNELQIYKPHFNFISHLNNCAGYYTPHNHEFVFNLFATENNEEKPSAYTYLEIMAHELKHAQFFTKLQNEYYKKQNTEILFPAPNETDYDMNNEYERFTYYYDLCMYYIQPTEVEACNYGIKKAKQIFDETNLAKTANGEKEYKDSTSLFDIRFFKQEYLDRVHNKKLIEYTLGDKAKDQLDKGYLLTVLDTELQSLSTQIYLLDPDTEENSKNGKLTSKMKDKNLKELINLYNEQIVVAKTLEAEIESDMDKLFHEYKQKACKEDILLYKF